MNTQSILLVEDNASDIELAKRALHKANIENPLIVAEDGQEALDYLFGTGQDADNDALPMPGLVLLDLNLPRVGGLEVLERIRKNERTRRLPVVILSSSKETGDVTTSYNFGANSYIRKPVDFQSFTETIKQLGSYWLELNEPPPVN
jgi:two-component system response regulator